MEKSDRRSISRLVIVRHGETVGDSRIRYHGINDVVLSSVGRAQSRHAEAVLAGEEFDHVISSPLARAWQTATILAPGRDIEIEDGLREVNFGRWEGLTREEIAKRDPILYDDWQAGGADFDYPGGDRRSDFRLRVVEALGRVLDRPGRSGLVVAHKGVIRVLVESLSGESLATGQPELGDVLYFSASKEGPWRRGVGPSSADS